MGLEGGSWPASGSIGLVRDRLSGTAAPRFETRKVLSLLAYLTLRPQGAPGLR